MVNGVYSSTQTQDAGPTGSTGPNARTLSGDDFMVLLMAQLRHQNPLEPMDEKAMMAQITQLNSLQELQKISSVLEKGSKSSNLTEAAGLIGKHVVYAYEEGKSGSGVVTGVSMEKGEAVLWVDEDRVPLGSILSVSEVEAEGA